MKNQALFSSKGKSKKLKCRMLQFLFGALRVMPHSDLGPLVKNKTYHYVMSCYTFKCLVCKSTSVFAKKCKQLVYCAVRKAPCFSFCQQKSVWPPLFRT